MIITFTGASGCGKTTLFKLLQKENPSISLVKSITTRQSRPSDFPGEYMYVSENEFELFKTRGRFLWFVEAHSNGYGTPKTFVEQAMQSKNLFFMLIVQDVLPTLLDYTNRKIIPFYITSPGKEELRARLAERGDKDADIEKRIQDCREWDEAAYLAALKVEIPYEFVSNRESPPEKFALLKIKSILKEKYQISI